MKAIYRVSSPLKALEKAAREPRWEPWKRDALEKLAQFEGRGRFRLHVLDDLSAKQQGNTMLYRADGVEFEVKRTDIFAVSIMCLTEEPPERPCAFEGALSA